MSSYVAYIVDVLSRIGPVKTRAMFGGHNVSLEGVTFGLIVDNILYLKVDDTNRKSFEDADLVPFSYSKKDGTRTSMSYHQVPDCLDDWQALRPWVEGALAAARRASAKKGTAPKAKRPR
jgi:DNA transformation protein and related proteins